VAKVVGVRVSPSAPLIKGVHVMWVKGHTKWLKDMHAFVRSRKAYLKKSKKQESPVKKT
jgi:hypothetical protein